MIYSEGDCNEVTGVYAIQGVETLSFTALYIGDRLFWGGAGCCFSTGAWRDELPWLNELGWRNE